MRTGESRMRVDSALRAGLGIREPNNGKENRVRTNDVQFELTAAEHFHSADGYASGAGKPRSISISMISLVESRTPGNTSYAVWPMYVV